MQAKLLPCRAPGERHPDWRKLYVSRSVETMPWYSSELDIDVERIITERKLSAGEFLDIGSGPGTQALHLTRLGFYVTGTDISPAACALAKKLCPGADFVEDDITESRLDKRFDYALDRGCFHVLDSEAHPRYVTSLARLLKPGGLLFLKCFSDENGPADWGPLRFSPECIQRTFEKKFRIEEVTRTVYQGSTDTPPKALFIVLRNI